MGAYFDWGNGIGLWTNILVGEWCFDWGTVVGLNVNILIGALGSVYGRMY